MGVDERLRTADECSFRMSVRAEGPPPPPPHPHPLLHRCERCSSLRMFQLPVKQEPLLIHTRIRLADGTDTRLLSLIHTLTYTYTYSYVLLYGRTHASAHRYMLARACAHMLIDLQSHTVLTDANTVTST